MIRCPECQAPINAPHRYGCSTLNNFMPHEPPEPHDNPIVDVLAALRRIEEKLDALSSPPAAESGEYMTVAEAAQHFKLSPTVLYSLKHLQCRRGRSIRFKRQALENHLRPRPYLRQAS